METSNFTANCVKFAQFANHNGKPREIRVIITNFYIPCSLGVPQLFTANLAKSAQFANTWCESHEINQLRTNFNKFFYFLFLTLLRQDPTPCLRELRESRNFTLTSRNLHFRIYPLLYCDTNFVSIVTRGSFQLHIHFTICDSIGRKENSFLYYKKANFPNFKPTFRAQAV